MVCRYITLQTSENEKPVSIFQCFFQPFIISVVITILRICQQKTWGQRRVLFLFLSAVPMNFGRWLKIYFRSFFVKASLYYCRICRLFVSTLICEFLFGTQPNQRTGLKELPYMLFGLIESIFCRKTTFAKKMISFNFFFYWIITAIFGSKIWENIPSELNQRLIGASSWMSWISKGSSIIKAKHIYLFGRFIHRQTKPSVSRDIVSVL